jgi:hypothetical protein
MNRYNRHNRDDHSSCRPLNVERVPNRTSQRRSLQALADAPEGAPALPRADEFLARRQFADGSREWIHATEAAVRCDAATSRRCNAAQRCDAATLQRCNAATLQRCDAATLQRGAALRCCDAATLQRCNAATLRRGNAATRRSVSTLRRGNVAQRCDATTLQRCNAARGSRASCVRCVCLRAGEADHRAGAA